MFSQSVFQQDSYAKQIKLIDMHPLAMIVSDGDEGFTADHIPLFLAETQPEPTVDLALSGRVLHGHIAKANPLSKRLSKAMRVLVVFQGPQTYISPNWYPSKQQHGKVVPTWNYSVLHIQGELRLIDDATWKIAMLNRLTEQMEGRITESPWQLSDAPAEYIDKQLKGLVGIEIEIQSVTGKWKMSQNQPEENQQGVRQGLLDSPVEGAQEVLRCMSALDDEHHA